MAVITPLQPICELASRASNGIEVTLLWNRRSDDLSVFVSDTRTGIEFEVATERHNALDIFNHPYAYAAARGIAYEEDRTSLSDAQPLPLAA
jgi:hypothetical protein